MQRQTLTVRQLNLYVRSLIEGDPKLGDVLVAGELSNFKNHYSSGHLYFTLKDKDAAIRCVMFRSNAVRLKFNPEDGMGVIIRGRVSVYERDGQYQLYAEEMQPDGIGDIALAFEQVKEKLGSEGLFDPESKRPIPRFPKKIAVVTSDTGAAVQDIMNILSRRWPLARIIMCPVAVQGEKAVPDMVSALDRIYNLSGIDVIIIGRGGGSIEDLWAFNSEILARKIYESPIPVISAVGHETDFTICDFVADLRAPTPSAAAELAVPDIGEIQLSLNKYNIILKNHLVGKYSNLAERFKGCLNSSCMRNPVDFLIGRKFENLDRVCDKLKAGSKETFLTAENSINTLAGKLDSLSPLKVLSRGYVAVSDKNGAVKNVESLKKGDSLNLEFSDGYAICEVKDTSVREKKL